MPPTALICSQAHFSSQNHDIRLGLAHIHSLSGGGFGAGTSLSNTAGAMCDVPDFYGQQRFGCTGGNVRRGRRQLLAPKKQSDPWIRTLHLDAWQSHLFNNYVAERICRGKTPDAWGCLTQQCWPVDMLCWFVVGLTLSKVT